MISHECFFTKRHLITLGAFALVCMCFVASPGDAQQAISPIGLGDKYESKRRESNENTVVIVGGPTTGTYIKMIEDLQYVLDKRETNELRVLPVVGVSGVGNLEDVLFLRNVDMCTTETGYFNEIL
jgi:hypothetical protein